MSVTNDLRVNDNGDRRANPSAIANGNGDRRANPWAVASAYTNEETMKFHSAIPSPNQLHLDLVSVSGFNPWLQHDSSNRVYMVSSHLGQMLVIKGSTERKCQTGAEREFGKYTFNVKMPCNGEIVEIIPRYRNTVGLNTISENPQTIVIYEDVETKELGMISLTNHCSNHQYFGFEYKAKEGMKKLIVGNEIKKDTVFLDSPSITDDGGYKYGIELNMALMTHPASSEDGILICKDVLPKLAFKLYENRSVEWGNKKFALNLYGH